MDVVEGEKVSNFGSEVFRYSRVEESEIRKKAVEQMSHNQEIGKLFK